MVIYSALAGEHKGRELLNTYRFYFISWHKVCFSLMLFLPIYKFKPKIIPFLTMCTRYIGVLNGWRQSVELSSFSQPNTWTGQWKSTKENSKFEISSSSISQIGVYLLRINYSQVGFIWFLAFSYYVKVFFNLHFLSSTLAFLLSLDRITQIWKNSYFTATKQESCLVANKLWSTTWILIDHVSNLNSTSCQQYTK